MAQTVFGAEYAVSVLNRAFNNTSPSNAVFNNQVKTAGDTEATQAAFAANFGKSFINTSDAALATQVLTNLGVLPSDVAEVQALEGALADVFGTVSKEDRGIVVLQLGTILSGLETATGDLAVYAPAAKAWNIEVERAYVYSSNSAHTTPQEGDDGAGSTTLTRFTDVLSGSAFTGYLDYNQFTGKDEQTLTTGDRLTGTAGDTDTLFAQQTAGSRPTLSGIEIISIDAKDVAPVLDLSDSTGVKKVVNYRSSESATLAFEGLKNLVDVEIDHTNANTSVKFNGSVVAGVNDSLNLSVKGAGVKAKPADFTITGDGIENLTINATEDASVLGNVKDADLIKLTITGDKNLTVGTKAIGDGFDSQKITTVDGSAATGNLFLNLEQSAARDQTVTTGTGDDVVVTGALSATDTFNLGEGNDRLVLTVASSNEAAKLQGVEEVEARVANTNLNLTSAPDVKLLAVAETAGFNNVTAAKSGTTVGYEGKGLANAVSSSAVTFDAVKFAVANAAGANDVFNFTFKNAGVALGANSTVAIGAVTNTSNNVETLNFAIGDVVASNTVTVADINGGAVKALNVTSDSKVVFNNVNDLTKLTAVDATGVKAGFTATFGALATTAASTIKLGGAGANTVEATSGANLGAAAATTATLLTLDASAGTGAQKLKVTNADVSVADAAATNTVAKVVAALGTGLGANVIGGSGADEITVLTTLTAISTIQGGVGADKITLGATGTGTDVIVLSMGDSGSSVGTGQTITNFNAGTNAAGGFDYLDLRNFGIDAGLQTVADQASALTGNLGDFTKGGVTSAVATYEQGANLVVAIDANGDDILNAGDVVITLIGVASADFTTADIIWAS